MAGLLQPDLLRQVAERGDVEAFRKLFQEFAPRLKSYMMRKGADAATAEELAQETLLTVWRKARLYHSRDKGSGGNLDLHHRPQPSHRPIAARDDMGRRLPEGRGGASLRRPHAR